jgi:DNA repair protein RecO (recombination protein O)
VYLLGYIPHLLHCSECLKIFDNEPVRFDSQRGGSLCRDCAGTKDLEISLGSIGSLARSLRVSHQQFDGFKLGATTIHDGHLMLSQVLRQILPREPKSLKFLTRLSARES